MAMEYSASPAELPADLRDKYLALKFANDHLEELESQLIIARKSRDEILKEISILHQSRAQAPIARVPLDILLTIFEQWDDDPLSRNRTLSLVCKTWYQIMQNSTGFWRDLVLRFGWDLRKNKSLLRFAELCHQLSDNQLLDVEIDLRGVLPYPDYISRILDESPAYFQELDWPETGLDFSDWASLVTAHLGGSQGLGGILYNRISQSILRKLIQEIGQVRRWKSLLIWMPDHLYGSFVDLALMELNGDFPNLERLSITGSTFGDPQYLGELSITCPKLRSFITNQDINLTSALRYFPALESIGLRSSYVTAQFLSWPSNRFTNLRKLELQDDGYVFSDLPNLDVVLFERLVSIHLSAFGSLIERILNLINAPMLELLHLHQLDAVQFRAPSTPILCQIKFLLIDRKAPTTKGASIGIGVFEEILRQTPSLQSLRLVKVDWSKSRKIVAAVRKIRMEGYPLTNMEEIILVSNRGHFLTQEDASLTVLNVKRLADQ